MLRCSNCPAIFDALERISETEEINHSENPLAKSLPWDKENAPGNAYWGTGLVISLLLLIGQIVYFEGYAFSQNPVLRPSLEKLCQQLNCQLPVYRNPGEFTLHGIFNPLPDQNYLFQAVITNQAAFTQVYPDIKLTLFDYNGKAFAHRIFRPQDYLPENSADTGMVAEATTEISLKIAAPETKVGGSTYELIYE
jgi:hypothetical protein